MANNSKINKINFIFLHRIPFIPDVVNIFTRSLIKKTPNIPLEK
jgi:hypothetical protein